jgi:hypothetical protein
MGERKDDELRILKARKSVGGTPRSTSIDRQIS